MRLTARQIIVLLLYLHMAVKIALHLWGCLVLQLNFAVDPPMQRSHYAAPYSHWD